MAEDLCAKAMAEDPNPILNAESGIKYYVRLIKEDGTGLQYLIDGKEGRRLKRVDEVSADPKNDYEMWYLEPKEGGAVDEYRLKNVGSELYLHDWVGLSDNNVTTIVAEYATTIDDTHYFNFNIYVNGSSAGRKLSIDSEDNADMYFNKGVRYFRIEAVFTLSDNLEQLIRSAKAYYDENNTATEEDMANSNPGKYPPSAKADLHDAITNAKDILANGNVDEAAISALDTAIKNYLAAVLIPKLNAEEGELYYVRLIKEDGTGLQYLKDAQEGRRLERVDAVSGSNYEKWNLEPKEGGAVDEYRLKNAGSGLYLSDWVELTDNDYTTIVAEYATTIDDTHYFNFNIYVNGASAGRKLSIDSEDNAKMYFNKDVRYFRIEKVTSISTVCCNPTDKNYTLFVFGRELNIVDLEINAEISVFDIAGRLIASETSPTNTFTTTLPTAGSYIISVKQAGEKTTSIVLCK
ncbi:MAG: T9SS type A sorting domain-containing protein [Monoglobales bacterium]